MATVETVEVPVVVRSRVDQILYDAEIARAGAEFARAAGNQPEENRLLLKSANLRSNAKQLDPFRRAAGWKR